MCIYRMLILFTSGLMKRYVKDYESSYKPICSSESGNNEDQSLEIADLFSAYLIIILGLIFAVSFVILELAISKINIRFWFYKGNTDQKIAR